MAGKAQLMRVRRLLWQLWPWRWWRAACALLRGVRLHPSAVLLGEAGRFKFGRGSVIGARVRADGGNAGRIVIECKVWLAADTEIETTTAVRIGRGTTIQRRSSINGSVRIGRGCILAPNVFVSSGTHPFRVVAHLPIREQEQVVAGRANGWEALDRPVWIQDDCWLGVNAVVCPGVTVGKGSVVGANTVVTRDVAPYSVVGGTPAREIGRRLKWQPPAEISAARPEDLVYVLSGQTAGGGGGRMALALTREEPLRLVLAIAGTRITLHYFAPQPVGFEIGGRHVHVPSGEGSLELAAGEFARALGGIVVDIRLGSGDDAAASGLQVFRIASA